MKLNQTRTIFRREFSSFLKSPGAYILLTLYLLITGWFFFSTFFLSGRADLRSFFQLMPLILSFTIPAITMRQFSEEYRSGSMEILGTLPVTTGDVIAGKSLSSLLFVGCMLLPTLSYPVFISFLGELDWGPVIGGYLGALFLSAAYIGIGLLASSATNNQIVAFIIGTVICLFLSIIDRMLVLIPSGLGQLLQNLGTGYHFTNISRGIIDSRDIIYFASMIFLSHYAAWIINREHR
ncbi:MAG: ABC transporter [Spirochaeta sp. LUC14_002_19_P3]|nr:MAG: ABC transporter [Spirochaeta sp. LUC14_002_19_P3]